jgi:hypothetical protein
VILDTQYEAWEAILDRAEHLREAVLIIIQDRGPMAAFELEPITGLRQSTVAARCSELANRKGKYDWPPALFDTGLRRTNRKTGRSAVVWTTVEPPPEVWVEDAVLTAADLNQGTVTQGVLPI